MMNNLFKKIISVCAVIVLSLTIVVGCSCGQKSIESFVVKSGTLKYTYLQNSEYDFDDLKIVVTYNDGTKEEVGREQLTISNFSTSNVGEFPITITYGSKSIELKLKVTNNQDEVYDIYGYEMPTSILTSNSNKSYVGQNDQDKESEYYIKNGIYIVGDDNPFVFFPNITVLNDENTIVPINSYKSVSKVYVKNVNTYELLEGDSLNNMVVIDDTKSSYDFSENAIGKYFKIEVRPYYLSEEQLLEVNDWTRSLEFKVVDGYNVTNAIELGVINNASDYDEKYVNAWNDFLTTHNVNVPNDLNGIVLHNDIKITKDSIPEEFFETTNNITYTKDYVDLYTRNIAKGSTFTLYGNYFTIDAKDIPLVNTETAEAGVSHTSLFKATLDDLTEASTTYFNIKDVSIIGNANRQNNESGFGGLIMGKFQSLKSRLENVIVKTFYINIYGDGDVDDNSELIVDNVKSYDAYQSLVYVFGGTDVVIQNSELKRAGGPAIIMQHVNPSDNINSAIPTVIVDGTTTIESKLLGTEAWFEGIPGLTTIATQIKALSTQISNSASSYGLSASFVQDNLMNVIAVSMSDGYTVTSEVAQGKVTIDSVDIINMMNGENTLVNSTLAQHPNYTILQSSAGGIAQITDTNSFDMLYTPENNPSALFAGDYLGLYAMGMGITLGYYH